MLNPFDVVADFESDVAAYVGCNYGVAVNSCTSALLLACKYKRVHTVEIPARTYVSVPQSIIHAGGRLKFIDDFWVGSYQLKPYPIVDAARQFYSGMYYADANRFDIDPNELLMCVSFHGKKILGLGQGGMILTNDHEAVDWFKKARFDGRSEGVPVSQDNIQMIGYHCYMSPDVAARGRLQLSFLPRMNDSQTDNDPDLREIDAFKPWIVD